MHILNCFICFLLITLGCTTLVKAESESKDWKFNTSNAGKFAEFQRLFSEYGYTLSATHIDLNEIQADPISVVSQKATQIGENILIEDTSLDVEGAEVGINVRWLLDNLSSLTGRKALWTVLLAYRIDQTVFIYKGCVSGTIVEPRGDKGFGFDPVFLPDGASETLAEAKPNQYNARALAVKALAEENLFVMVPAIENWDGPWQDDSH